MFVYLQSIQQPAGTKRVRRRRNGILKMKNTDAASTQRNGCSVVTPKKCASYCTYLRSLRRRRRRRLPRIPAQSLELQSRFHLVLYRNLYIDSSFPHKSDCREKRPCFIVFSTTPTNVNT